MADSASTKRDADVAAEPAGNTEPAVVNTGTDAASNTKPAPAPAPAPAPVSAASAPTPVPASNPVPAPASAASAATPVPAAVASASSASVADPFAAVVKPWEFAARGQAFSTVGCTAFSAVASLGKQACPAGWAVAGWTGPADWERPGVDCAQGEARLICAMHVSELFCSGVSTGKEAYGACVHRASTSASLKACSEALVLALRGTLTDAGCKESSEDDDDDGGRMPVFQFSKAMGAEPPTSSSFPQGVLGTAGSAGAGAGTGSVNKPCNDARATIAEQKRRIADLARAAEHEAALLAGTATARPGLSVEWR